MKRWLFLDVVIRKSATILKLLSSKDEPLLIGRNPFFVLNLGLNIFNAVRWLNFQGDGFAGQRLDKNLHSTTETQHQMKRWLFLDVVIRKSATILKLLSSKDEPLLIGRNPFFVLNLGLNIFNAVRWLNFQGDGFAGQCLDENLHSATETQHQMKRWLFLDVVVGKSAAILKLLAGEDKPLLIGRNTFLVLNLGLDVLNAVGRFHLQRDGLAGQGLHENLHASPQTQDEMKRRLLLNVVVGQGTTIFQLLPREDQPLLVGWDAFLVLDFCLDILDAIRGLDLESDGLARQGFDEDLHFEIVEASMRTNEVGKIN